MKQTAQHHWLFQVYRAVILIGFEKEMYITINFVYKIGFKMGPESFKRPPLSFYCALLVPWKLKLFVISYMYLCDVLDIHFPDNIEYKREYRLMEKVWCTILVKTLNYT